RQPARRAPAPQEEAPDLRPDAPRHRPGGQDRDPEGHDHHPGPGQRREDSEKALIVSGNAGRARKAGRLRNARKPRHPLNRAAGGLVAFRAGLPQATAQTVAGWPAGTGVKVKSEPSQPISTSLFSGIVWESRAEASRLASRCWMTRFKGRAP